MEIGDDEKLIVVDEHDNIIDYKSKSVCHDGAGILHRAFSIFIFNDQEQVLIQARSEQKRLWPFYWSNSCCSHPRQGETYEFATVRRIKEELGITASLKFLFTFQYQASFGEEGSENEFCAVYIGTSNDPIVANINEIASWKFIGIEELEKDMAGHPENYTPWFEMEWKRIRRDHQAKLKALWE